MIENLKPLLKLLMDGNYHSSAELARQLNATELSIKEKIKKIIELDLEIVTNIAQEYCIPKGLELLEKQKIMNYTKELAISELFILDSVCSTNDFLWNIIKTNINHNKIAILAEKQEKGRGRLGRQWYSPFGRNVYLSYSYSFTNNLQNLSGLSLVVGLAVIIALQAFGANGLTLKWPNDILFNDKKLSGILIETQKTKIGKVQAVIGIGINLYIYNKELNSLNAIDLHSIVSNIISRNKLVAAVINSLHNYLNSFIEHGFEYFIPQLDSYDCLKDQIINIKTSKGTFEGIMCGVNKYGGMKIKIGNNIKIFYCADIEKIYRKR